MSGSFDPSDGGGGNKVQEGSSSFRDKLVGKKKISSHGPSIDLLKEKLARVEFDHGNHLYPKLYLDKTILEEIDRPWKEALIVKLLGKEVGFLTMRDRLHKLWKPSGGFDILDLGYGFFLVKFDVEGDRTKVIDGGPWMLFDHYLSIRPWSRDFIASDAKIDSTMVWIRFPCLNMAYYYDSVLWAMASQVGLPVKIDHHTLKLARSRFARVCVEIDLYKPVVGMVFVEDAQYKVEYEGLHIICSNCGCYGHYSRDCHSKNNGEASIPLLEKAVVPHGVVDAEMAVTASTPSPVHELSQPHGEWLVVARKSRPRSRSDAKGDTRIKAKDNVSNISGNRFDSLVREEENILHEEIINDEDTMHAIVAPSSGEKIKSGFKIKKKAHQPDFKG